MTTSTQAETTAAPAPVAVLGLGLMGHALAAALLRAGHPTTVWNRTAAKADDLVAAGAVRADTPAAAVAAAPLVIACVTDYDALHTFLDPVDPAALGGRTLVNLTTGTSAQARDTAAWAAGRGLTYLDGAIMATPQGIGTAEITIVVSGPRAEFDRHTPALRSLAGDTPYLGADHGLTSLYEMAIVGLMWSILNGWLQGAALLGTAGVSVADYTAIAAKGIQTVADWLPGYAGQIDTGVFPPDDATLDIHRAAMAHLVQESESLGVNAEFPALIKSLADRAAAAGHGGEGYPVMIEEFRRPAPRPA
ncbi:NAD(P)-dependent oxidoreductase [Streptomyces sp. CMB-StM0423]|uniref:NAD(P)-dependent oxidoreductase n=1 Tax=Streptomyces sp. CMB-StM0423 TaxID=2059884 RepID=UPI000C71200E|nr:NAD(P)-binding domain-containing protein [Streptomyces sp. CMB-StM0423]AUH40626.1 6-phosphogluconate dehydrogenase [Streptomyces sp. CMB-StM0423]